MNTACAKMSHLENAGSIIGHHVEEVIPEFDRLLSVEQTLALPRDHYAEFHRDRGDGHHLLLKGKRITWCGVDAVIFYITDETARMEKENRYFRQVTAMTEADDDNLLTKGQHSITNDKIIYYCKKAESSLSLEEGGSYDAAIELLATTAVNLEKAEEIRTRLQRKALLQDYGEDQKTGSLEYLRSQKNGRPFWTQLKYVILEVPGTDNINLFIYTYDISEQVLETHMIDKLSAMEYDVLGVIDVTSRTYTRKRVRGKMEGPETSITGDFEELARARIKTVVVPAEQQEILDKFSLDNIIGKLESSEVYFFTYSIQCEDGTEKRKKYQFCYLDESRSSILYYRSDITEMYNREQEQLRQTEAALIEAKKASEAKTEFFSRMSHDMRTPMNGILGIAGLSTEEADPQVLQDNIMKIRSSGEYLLGLINDTLDFQKIESGRLTIEPQIIYAKDLLTGIVNLIKNTAEEKGVTFRVVNKNADLGTYIKADPMRMKQIFVNLLSNAVKFTPKGGTVELGFELLSRDGRISHDLVTITDTGIGMSKEFLEKGIFKPFSPEYNTVTASYAGTGLGLSIAKRLVELMGGTIFVESEQGVGTKFTVAIDFERVEASEVTQTASEDAQKQSAARGGLRGKKILLAEDHPLNAEIATKLLKKAGCEVTWAQNGEECLETYSSSETKQYDIILMDIRMPLMDGLETAKAIRALDRADAGEIPIIAMTANAYEDDIKLSLAAGMNGHLAKPIDPKALYEKIAELL
ncbi:MAG: response regulator [Lachnospiraceae bacterium]|nr:response regulator [Lachnospiraceae bacterium]